jgi:hypothetical protein
MKILLQIIMSQRNYLLSNAYDGIVHSYAREFNEGFVIFVYYFSIEMLSMNTRPP